MKYLIMSLFTLTISVMVFAGWYKDSPSITVMHNTSGVGKSRWVYEEPGIPDDAGPVWGTKPKYITAEIKDWIVDVPVPAYSIKNLSKDNVRVWVQWPIEGN